MSAVPQPASRWPACGSTTAATGCTARSLPRSSTTCRGCSVTTCSAANAGDASASPGGGCRSRSRPSTPRPTCRPASGRAPRSRRRRRGPAGRVPTPSPRSSAAGWGRPWSSGSTGPTRASCGGSTPITSAVSRHAAASARRVPARWCGACWRGAIPRRGRSCIRGAGSGRPGRRWPPRPDSAAPASSSAAPPRPSSTTRVGSVPTSTATCRSTGGICSAPSRCRRWCACCDRRHPTA